MKLEQRTLQLKSIQESGFVQLSGAARATRSRRLTSPATGMASTTTMTTTSLPRRCRHRLLLRRYRRRENFRTEIFRSAKFSFRGTAWRASPAASRSIRPGFKGLHH